MEMADLSALQGSALHATRLCFMSPRSHGGNPMIDNHADRQSMEQFVMLLDGHTPDCIEAEP